MAVNVLCNCNYSVATVVHLGLGLQIKTRFHTHQDHCVFPEVTFAVWKHMKARWNTCGLSLCLIITHYQFNKNDEIGTNKRTFSFSTLQKLSASALALLLWACGLWLYMGGGNGKLCVCVCVCVSVCVGVGVCV